MEKLKRRIDGMKDNLAIYKNEASKLKEELNLLGVKKVDEKNISKITKDITKKLKAIKNRYDVLEESIENSLEEFEDVNV